MTDAKLEEKLERLSRRLQQAKARVQLAEARESTRARKAETRRLILLGRWLERKMAESPKLEGQVRRGLEAYLTRPFDRALFGFDQGDGNHVPTRVEITEARASTRARKAETRRLILLGRWLEKKAGASPKLDGQVRRDLDKQLTRPHDRALFGFGGGSKDNAAPQAEST